MRPRNASIPAPGAEYPDWLRYLVQSSDPQAGELPMLVQAWSQTMEGQDLTADQKRFLSPFIAEGSAWLAELQATNRARAAKQTIAADMTNVVLIRGDLVIDPMAQIAGMVTEGDGY